MLKITKQNNSIVVEGVNNYKYPDNAVLSFPLNSIICEVDESDIITFHSASNYDVVFSGNVNEITINGETVTKENVGELFGAISNTSGGGGGEGGTTDYNDLSNKPKINGKTLIGNVTIDETDPIWNAEKGNYYTKDETDGLVNEAKGVASSAMSVAASAEGIASAAHSKADEALEELENKADKSWVEGKGYLTEETDPTVPTWVKNITEADIEKWNKGGNTGDVIGNNEAPKDNIGIGVFNGTGEEIHDGEPINTGDLFYMRPLVVNEIARVGKAGANIYFQYEDNDSPWYQAGQFTDWTVYNEDMEVVSVNEVTKGSAVYVRWNGTSGTLFNVNIFTKAGDEKGVYVYDGTDTPSKVATEKDITKNYLYKKSATDLPDGIGIIVNPTNVKTVFPFEVNQNHTITAEEAEMKFFLCESPTGAGGYYFALDVSWTQMINWDSNDVVSVWGELNVGKAYNVADDSLIGNTFNGLNINDFYIKFDEGAVIFLTNPQATQFDAFRVIGDGQGIYGVENGEANPLAYRYDVSNVESHLNEEVNRINSKIYDIELAKFPNLTLFGNPIVQGSQISSFSANDYAQFPFLVDFRGKNSFRIDFEFTTGEDVINQQNIIDSAFGLAVAIRNSRVIVAAGTNGTSWNLGEHEINYEIQPQMGYHLTIEWRDGNEYIASIWGASATFYGDALYPTQIIVGKSLDNTHIFGGSITLHNAYLLVDKVEVWRGMDDLGLSTRLATDMSNIDEAGVQKVNDIVALKTINGQSIKGDGNIEIGGGGGSYLPLSGGTLTGRVTVGDKTNDSITNAYTHLRKVNDKYVGMAFSVGSDAGASIQHKVYGTDFTSARNDAVLSFDYENGLRFGKAASGNVADKDMKKVLTVDDAYTKAEIDALIGVINAKLTEIIG